MLIQTTCTSIIHNEKILISIQFPTKFLQVRTDQFLLEYFNHARVNMWVCAVFFVDMQSVCICAKTLRLLCMLLVVWNNYNSPYIHKYAHWREVFKKCLVESLTGSNYALLRQENCKIVTLWDSYVLKFSEGSLSGWLFRIWRLFHFSCQCFFLILKLTFEVSILEQRKNYISTSNLSSIIRLWAYIK